MVKILEYYLIMKMGDENPKGSFNDASTNVEDSEVALLVTWCVLTIDAFFMIGLSNHAHYLFEVFVTVTLHLGLTNEDYNCRINVAVFVFVIVMMKNLMTSRFIDYPQTPIITTIEDRSVASEVV